MTPETLEKYNAAKAALTEKQKTLTDWLKANSRKRPTPELNKQYGDLGKAVADAQKAVESLAELVRRGFDLDDPSAPKS